MPVPTSPSRARRTGLGSVLEAAKLLGRVQAAERRRARRGPSGEKGAILRGERLYHSHIIERRAARDTGAMASLTDRQHLARAPTKAAAQAEPERLPMKVARLETEAARGDAALELMGRANALVEPLSKSAG